MTGRIMSSFPAAVLVLCLGLVPISFLALTPPAMGQEQPGQSKAGIMAEIEGLQLLLALESRELEDLTAEFDQKKQDEDGLKNEIAKIGEGFGDISGLILTTAKETDSLLRKSMASAGRKGRFEKIQNIINDSGPKGLDDLTALSDVLFGEMKDSGRVDFETGTFVDATGRIAQGEILRVGGLAAYFRQGEASGFLSLQEHTSRLKAWPTAPSRQRKADIDAYFGGRGESLPLDLGGGAALSMLRPGRTILEWLSAGGILVLPILLVAAAALILAGERLVSLARLKSNSDRIWTQVRNLARKQDWDGCRSICRKNMKAPACRIMLAGLTHRETPKEVLENAVQEAMLRQLPVLERFLPTLSVLGAVAPLLGLLGTVTGMIDTFQVITVFGTSDPKLMAGGISEALITTELGLAVAIPIVLIHHFLERRVDAIVGDMEEKGLALLGIELASSPSEQPQPVRTAA